MRCGKSQNEPRNTDVSAMERHAPSASIGKRNTDRSQFRPLDGAKWHLEGHRRARTRNVCHKNSSGQSDIYAERVSPRYRRRPIYPSLVSKHGSPIVMQGAGCAAPSAGSICSRVRKGHRATHKGDEPPLRLNSKQLLLRAVTDLRATATEGASFCRGALPSLSLVRKEYTSREPQSRMVMHGSIYPADNPKRTIIYQTTYNEP